MIVNRQKPIVFHNMANAKFDPVHLEQAILLKTHKPVARVKRVFMFGKYPAISIHGKKYHIHRLLTEYWYGNISNLYVHHINGDKLDASITNLQVQTPAQHQSLTNKGRSFTEIHRKRIGDANRRRRGVRYKLYENPELLK